MTVALSVMMGLAIMAVFVFALWRTGYLTRDRRLTGFLIPRQSPETAYGQVRHSVGEASYDAAYPIVTYDEVARRLGRITDVIEATLPCPRSRIGEHSWEPARVEIMQWGRTTPIRLDEYLQCELCGSAIDAEVWAGLYR